MFKNTKTRILLFLPASYSGYKAESSFRSRSFLCRDCPDKDGPILDTKYSISYMTRSSAVMRYLFTDRLVILYSEKVAWVEIFLAKLQSLTFIKVSFAKAHLTLSAFMMAGVKAVCSFLFAFKFLSITGLICILWAPCQFSGTILANVYVPLQCQHFDICHLKVGHMLSFESAAVMSLARRQTLLIIRGHWDQCTK